MHGKTRNALLGYGLDTELIDRIARFGHTVELLRALSRKDLRKHYTEDDVEKIKSQIERLPIPDDVIQKVLGISSGACCFCNDANSSRPYQIHHIDPYSETQDNSEENLLLVCPTHHSAIHANKTPRPEQKSIRGCWYSTVEVASAYANKGLIFPFGLFQPLDYTSPPRLSELVEFGPLSPSTALASCPIELATVARARLEQAGFLLILGGSGSGKTTYAIALGGSYASDGFKVFRHRFDKNDHDALKQISLFISTCVTKAIVVLDDANTWATAADLQQLGKLAAGLSAIRVIATWTSDDSDDGAKLHASDLPKQALTWSDLRPAVVETLLNNEREVVEALQKYEDDRSIGSLGFGLLDSKLEDRIRSLGEKPKTVYEFIFGLRGGGSAVAEELRQLIDDDRSDLPLLFAAIEQIADFERPISITEATHAYSQFRLAGGLPPATESWVQTVLQRQTQKRRLVRIRDRYTTIHRKWAARLIAAGLSSPVAKSTTEELLKSEFRVPSTRPERLLRLWSWLRTLDESRPFIQEWVRTMSPECWSVLVANCVGKGLMEVGFLAERMHLLRDVGDWTHTVGMAFEKNASLIAPLVHTATPDDWYWLRELSFAMNHACPKAWTKILQDWDRKSVADLLLNTCPGQFETVSWTLNDTPRLCPGWLEEVGKNISWDAFVSRFELVEPGYLRSLFQTITVYGILGKKLKRSMLRTIAEATRTTMLVASLDNIRVPMTDMNLGNTNPLFPRGCSAGLWRVECQRNGATTFTKPSPSLAFLAGAELLG